MEKDLKKMLEDEIGTEIEKMGSLAPGTDEHAKAVESLTKLYKLNIEETENEREFRAKCDQEILADQEMKLKEAQLKDQVKDRYFRLAMEGASLVLPLVFYGIWMRKGFKFEETGTFTSTTFRGLFNRFRPTKK